MTKSNVCDYSDAYILVKGTLTITVIATNEERRQADERNKGEISKNQALFTDCISEINIKQADKAKDHVVVMPMYSQIEYSDNYSTTSESL